MNEREPIWQCRGAWILVIISIIFWLWFGVGSAMVEADGWFNWLMHLMIPGGIFILSAVVAWRCKAVGGILYALEGVVATAFLTVALLTGRSNPSTLLLMVLTLALPPLIGGILFLICAQQRQTMGASDNP
jgi:hypothetical protein